MLEYFPKSKEFIDNDEYTITSILHLDKINACSKANDGMAPCSTMDMSLKTFEHITQSPENLIEFSHKECPCKRIVLSGEPQVIFMCCHSEMHGLCYFRYIEKTQLIVFPLCPFCKAFLTTENIPVLMPPSVIFSVRGMIMSEVKQKSKMILECVISSDGEDRWKGIQLAFKTFKKMKFSEPVAPN